jgi:hypothetical protein
MLLVRIQLRSIPGGWRASVGHADGRPAETDLSEAAVASAAEQIGRLLRPAAVLTSDAKRSRDEDAAGTQLETLLRAPETHAALHRLIGEARGAGKRALILVDAPEPGVRALPWELLGSPSPLEARGDAIIARLVGGRPAASVAPADRFTVVLTTLTPDDALCTSRLTRLQARFDALGIPWTDDVSPFTLRAGPTVLHLVAHGQVADTEAEILRADGPIGAGTAAHGLAPLLKTVQLVILDVCDAGNTSTDEAHAPGARLVDAGAPAVVAPSTRLGLEAAEGFADGLYTALTGGQNVASAVAAGRRAVRALGKPHPDSRWANAVLHVAGAEPALQQLQRSSWRPDGWDPQPPDVAALLDRARGLAAPHGFVGFEHLLAAWPEAGGGAWCAHIRYLLAHQPDPRQRLGAMRPRPDRPTDFRGTRRLRAMRPHPTDIEGFAQILWNDLDDVLQDFFGLPRSAGGEFGTSGTTLDPVGADPLVTGPASRLEVLGGPEDGRSFAPDPSGASGSAGRIGRATPDTPGLYGDTHLVDPYLSRKAVGWAPSDPSGKTLIHLYKPAKRLHDGVWVAIHPGDVELRVADQLALTPATRVRAL